MSNNNRKYCVVPQCFNSNVKTPEKLFFCVPKNAKTRMKWMTCIKKVIGPKTVAFCCEDHFDVENDMNNYVKYKLVGGLLKLKNDVVPHMFACQNRLVAKPERSVMEKLKIKSSENIASTSHDLEELYNVVDSVTVKVENIDIDPLECTTGDTTSEVKERSAEEATPYIEVEECVECSSCRARIQQHAMVFRCVECADATLCCACAPLKHARHCVMRLPSTRVYRVLEDVFQKLRREVRSRLYPDGDLLQLEHVPSCETAGLDVESQCDDDGRCSDEVLKTGCEEWLDEEALDSYSDKQPSQPQDDAEPFSQHLPLLQVKEEGTSDSGSELQTHKANIHSKRKSPNEKACRRKCAHREGRENSEEKAYYGINTNLSEQFSSSKVTLKSTERKKNTRTIHSPQKKPARRRKYYPEDDSTEEISEKTKAPTILIKKKTHAPQISEARR